MNPSTTNTSSTSVSSTNKRKMKKRSNTYRILKSHYRNLPRQEAIAMLTEFGDAYGLECLRADGNFHFLSSIDPACFDMFDLYMALRFVINAINDAPDDNRMLDLSKRVTARLGPLDKPIAITLIGLRRHCYVIEPEAWINSRLH